MALETTRNSIVSNSVNTLGLIYLSGFFSSWVAALIILASVAQHSPDMLTTLAGHSGNDVVTRENTDSLLHPGKQQQGHSAASPLGDLTYLVDWPVFI